MAAASGALTRDAQPGFSFEMVVSRFFSHYTVTGRRKGSPGSLHASSAIHGYTTGNTTYPPRITARLAIEAGED